MLWNIKSDLPIQLHPLTILDHWDQVALLFYLPGSIVLPPWQEAEYNLNLVLEMKRYTIAFCGGCPFVFPFDQFRYKQI